MSPPGTAVRISAGPTTRPDLLPQEEALIAARRFSPKREQEFRIGRACAHAALADLGEPLSPLLTGPDRAPIWPPGCTGSISHSQDYVVAAALRSFELTIGVDVEHLARVPAELGSIVTAAGDEAAAEMGEAQLLALRFSAKESVFKAINARRRTWLGFQDIAILRPAGGAFVALARPRDTTAQPMVLAGRYAFTSKLVATVAVRLHRSG